MKVNRLTALAALLGLAPGAFADLTAYSQDFEALNMADPAALAADGHKIFANVFDPVGNYLYGYGTFDAPNGGGGFSAIATGLGGAAQGIQYLDIYNDYNNGDHANGNYIEANVFHEQPIGAANVGQTWTWAFDYLRNPAVNNGQLDSTMFAFVKVLKSSDGSYATLALQLLETSAASSANWASGSLDQLIDPAFAGELLQFGFFSYATNYNDSSCLYDNLEWSSPSGMDPSLEAYSQDFEGLNMADPAALTADGYKIFANVFDPMGGYLYGYGTFDAPNGGPGFSAIAAAFGGVYQGAQQLSIFSDYNNADHGNGNYIEASVFQEQTIGAVDVGDTWRFSYDYLKNPNVVNGDGDTTASAFVKVLKISDGSFATLAYLVRDTSDASTTAWASSAMDLLIDPAFAGELLQFGFASYATNYNDSSRIYDNIDFDMLGTPGIGKALCLGNPNSTGVAADLTITGSSAVVDNNVTLSVSQLQTNQFGYFLTSMENGFAYNPGGSDGHLCIGSATIGRYNSNVFNSGATGTATFSLDLTSIPTSSAPVMAAAGETHYFQYWSRDLVGGVPTSTFSGAAGVTFN